MSGFLQDDRRQSIGNRLQMFSRSSSKPKVSFPVDNEGWDGHGVLEEVEIAASGHGGDGDVAAYQLLVFPEKRQGVTSGKRGRHKDRFLGGC